MSQLSIRTTLVAGAFLLGTVPLLLLAMILPSRVEKALLLEGEQRLILTAKHQANLMQQMLLQHLETLRAIANSEFLNSQIAERNTVGVTPENLAGVNRRLRGFMNAFEVPYEGVFVSDAKGTVFAGLKKNGDTKAYENIDIQDRAYFRRCRDTIQPAMDGPFVSKASSDPIVVVVVPLKSPQGAFAGLVGMSLNSRYIAGLVAKEGLGKTGFVVAIDRSGTIAAHANPEEVLAGDLSRYAQSPELLRRMTSGETGLEIYQDRQGEKRVAAFAPVPLLQWSVAATQSEHEFTTESDRMRQELLIGVALCMTIALVAALLFSTGLIRTIRMAIKAVAESTERVGRVSSTIAEQAASLAKQVNAQAQDVQGVSSAVTELAATIKSNSIRAGAVAAIVRRAEAKVGEAQDRVEAIAREERQVSATRTATQGGWRDFVLQEFAFMRDDTAKVDDLVGEIAEACSEQSIASRVASESLSRFEQAVHAGSMTATQSAKTAESLKEEARAIQAQMDRLQRLVDGSGMESHPRNGRKPVIGGER